MASKVNLILTLVDSNNLEKTDLVANLVSIDKDEIRIFSKQKSKNISKALVSLCYGNNAKIFFFLNKPTQIIAKRNGYEYCFKAPKKQSKMIRSIKIDTADCTGYQKLLLLVSPKHMKKAKHTKKAAV